MVLRIIKKLFLIIFLTILFIVLFTKYQDYSLSAQLEELTENKTSSKETPITTTKDSTFTFLTYNVWGLPYWTPTLDKRNRYPSLPDSLLMAGTDIICLQETFDDKLRKYILNYLSDSYYYNSNYLCNRNFLGLINLDCFGGLMTFSKYPIKWEQFYTHEITQEMKYDEKIGQKGFLISKLKTEIGDINIINIHLHSGRIEKDDQIRLKQLKYLKEKIEEHALFDDPTILTGDLNIIHPSVSDLEPVSVKSKSYSFIVDSLNFEDSVPKLTSDDYTYDHTKNPYATVFQKAQKLDYCFYKIPDTFQASVNHHEVVFNKGNILSDHFGFATSIRLEQ